MVNKWIEFIKANKGQGLNFKQLSLLYKHKNKSIEPLSSQSELPTLSKSKKKLNREIKKQRICKKEIQENKQLKKQLELKKRQLKQFLE
jgi:hypothetical protein